ncbi:PAS domain S-box protein [Methanogenium sp. S4BF]|uniref:PAS domain S-box protein n=1 Tax=Methanogenium sp. S4BF TaxID=1789226 RepID=UPI002416C38C|nr:PAS domain S-box protein [Methanogenium sp. S4BF]WFN35108.1 PAS domain S-box protein [Methanogenium sp. S4BF]
MPSEQELLDRILNILKFKSKGMTITEISHVTNIHRNSIAKYLQVLLASGKVDVQLIGNAKVYTLSRRLPINSMLHCSPDLIVLLNHDRKIIQVNDKYLKYFDLDEKNVLNKEIPNPAIPVISEENLLPLIDNSIENGEKSCREIMYTHRDTSYYFLIKYIPSVLEDGEHGLIIIIKDFTEEKRIRDALTENEEKFKNLFHNANDSIFLYDITDDQRIGKLIEVNDTACKKLQYTRDEFFQMEFGEIFHSEFHGPDCSIETGLAEKYHSIYGGIQVRKDGTRLPVEASAHVFSLHDKLVVLYIIRDVSERKNAENNLKLSENRYRDIVEGQQELICRISPDHQINYVNDAFCRHFTIQKDPHIIKSLESLDIHQDDKEAIQKCMNLADIERQSKIIEFRIQGQGRKTRWIESSISPILDTEGNIHEFQFVGRDITEAVLAKKALKRNEENTRFLLNSTNDNSLLINLNGRILSLNKSSCEYIRNYCSDDSLNIKSITGRSIFEFIPEEIARNIRDVTSEITVSKISDSFVDEIGGRTYDFSLSPIVNSDGEVEKIAVVKRDITERQEYESNLTSTISRLTDIIDFLPEATFVINSDSEVIAWNKAMEQLTGVPKEEIIGRGDNSYSIPFYGAKRAMLIDYVISRDMTQYNPPDTIWKEGNSLNAEIWSAHMNNKKGAHLWVKATGLFDKEGNVIGAIESIQDMTHRKRMEDELLQSEVKYRDLIEKTCAILLKTDITGKILFVNEYGENLLGYQKGELIEKNAFDTIFSEPMENNQIFKDIIDNLLENPAQFRVTENKYTDRNGEIKWIAWTNSPIIDAKGHLTGISAVGTDITTRKKSEIKEKTYIKNLEFISRSAMNFAKHPNNEKIFDYISSELISLIPGGVAVVTSHTENHETLKIKSIKGEIEGYENMLSTMLNQKVLDKQFRIPDDYRQYLNSNRLIHLSGGLYDLFMKNFSEDVCKTINDVLDLYECYMIGISRDNTLFGSISFAVPHRINDEITSIIEIFVNQASVTLQRCWYEEELAKNTAPGDPVEKEIKTQPEESQKDLRTILETIRNNHIIDIRKQNEEFASICNKNQNRPVLSVDRNGTITRANPKITEILGGDTSIIGKEILTFIPTPSHHEIRDIQNIILNNPKEEPIEVSVPLMSQGGAPVNVTWNLEKIFDHTGDVSNILWIGSEYDR